jgi:FKBP-type peptidyl-prolyl cis-trans isomerase FklB
MKSLNCLLAGAAIALAFEIQAAEEKPLTSQKEKASYGVGINVGKSFKSDLIDLDVEAFFRGFKDALAGARPAVTEAELEQAMNALRADVSRKSEERVTSNRKAGEDLLAKNKDDKKITVEPSGVQYAVLKEGNGPIPKATDTVKVHYRGTLVDGTEFDSSYKRNEPATFAVNQVIKGWTEVLQKMKVGSKWKIFVPSDLAYGDEGRPPVIPPASTLIFEIELLGIEKS